MVTETFQLQINISGSLTGWCSESPAFGKLRNVMPNEMTTDKIKNINQTLGFFSITVGWTLTNLLYSIYLVLTYGKATDSGVVLIWSALYIYIAWAIFIIYPLNKLDHENLFFKRHIFPFVAAGYAGVVYTILVGGLFRDFGVVGMFMPLALSIGLFFGFTYSTLIANDRIVNLLNDKPPFKLFSFLSPVLILTFFLWLLPALFPSVVYRFMPDGIQDKIFVKTIVNYKVGDSFTQLENSVPGYFDNWVLNGNGGVNSSGPLIDYELQVRNDTITKLIMTIHK